MGDSQVLHAHYQKSCSFLTFWSGGIWPLSSGTQFKGTSFSEKFHLSSSAKNNDGEKIYLEAESHPQARHHARESWEKGESVHLIRNICVGLVKPSGLAQGNTHTHTL